MEIAIVGGGPAGASTALHLLARRPDLAGRIALFERRALPREKYCGGAVSAWGLDVLARLGLERLAHGVTVAALAVRVGDRVSHVHGPALGMVVRRSEFDAALVREAERRGAVVHERTEVRALTHRGGAWQIETPSGEHRARVIVGADGASGFSRRALGLGEPRPRARLYLVETPGAETRDGVASGTLLFDLTPAMRGDVQGYYWDFPAPLDGVPGTSRGVFHLNSRRLDDPATLKHSLARSLAERAVSLDRVALKAHSIRPIQLGAPASVPGALLVGEAAGIDPVTGEGIAHALAYGELAASAICEAIGSGDLAFRDWSARIERSFLGRHLRDACRLAPYVYGPHAARHARLLVGSRVAMALGARWYRGETVSRAARYGLAARLVGDYLLALRSA